MTIRRGPLRLVGDVSYSFYLWHWPVLVIVAGYVGHELSVAANLALMIAAFGLSYVTYRLYENPLRHARSLRVPRFGLCLWPVTVLGDMSSLRAAAANPPASTTFTKVVIFVIRSMQWSPTSPRRGRCEFARMRSSHA